MKTKTYYIKIISVLVVSFLIVKFGVSEVFLSNTPKIRPNIGKHLLARINGFINDNTSKIASLFTPKPGDLLKDIPFRTVSKGIYAKDKDNISYTLIKENEVEWVEYTFEIKGKEVKIKVPKGQPAPPKELIEKSE